ncbi:MAG: PAS domain S-box protein, partial [Deltaproteobacteria bacterium]
SSAQHQSTDKEYRIISHDTRADKWVRIIAEFELDSQGNPATIIGTIQDITIHKKAEKELRETHNFLENLLNYANAPIIVWNPEFRITRFNHAFEHLTGYPAQEVIGKELRMLFPEGSRKESLRKIERTLTGEYWESVEIPILHKNGNVRVALWNSANIHAKDGKEIPIENSAAPIQDDQGKTRGVVLVFRDVSRRRLAEKALMASESFNRSLIESSPLGILYLDDQGVILYENPAMCKIMGVPEGVLVLTESLNLLKHNKAFDNIVQKYAPLLGYTEQELAEKITEQLRSKIATGDAAEIRITKKTNEKKLISFAWFDDRKNNIIENT